MKAHASLFRPRLRGRGTGAAGGGGNPIHGGRSRPLHHACGAVPLPRFAGEESS